jgi:alpha-L-fucosidase
MEQRLAEIGAWLATNGEAIYGTRPFTLSRQWSDGTIPTVDYNKEYDSAYDVSKLTASPQGGKAAIDAFFTKKGTAVYAILPRWPGRRFVWKQAAALRPVSVTMLGADGPLRFEKAGDTLVIDLPAMPASLLAQPAWVIKLAQ